MLSFTLLLLRLLAFTCLVQEDVWKQVNSMSETSFQNSFQMFIKRCGYDPYGVGWDGNHQDVPEGIRKEL